MLPYRVQNDSKYKQMGKLPELNHFIEERFPVNKTINNRLINHYTTAEICDQ